MYIYGGNHKKPNYSSIPYIYKFSYGQKTGEKLKKKKNPEKISRPHSHNNILIIDLATRERSKTA